jgi:hypothetical protein
MMWWRTQATIPPGTGMTMTMTHGPLSFSVLLMLNRSIERVSLYVILVFVITRLGGFLYLSQQIHLRLG